MHGCPWIHALLLLAVLPIVAAQPWPFCNKSSSSYSVDDIYYQAVETLITTLSQKASTSGSRFATAVTSDPGPDTIYGLMLCRGDITESDCSNCGTSAVQNWGGGTTTCDPLVTDMALCFNQCYIRLSDKNFLDSTDNSGQIIQNSGTNISSRDVAGYEQAIAVLLNATINYAVEKSWNLFATGEWVGPGSSNNIYSVAQCAGNLLPSECRGCLEGILSSSFEQNRDGARVAGSRCTLRYEVGLTPFYNGSANVVLQDKEKKSVRIINIVVAVRGVLIFLFLGMCMLRKLYFREGSEGNQDYAMFEGETPLHIDIRRFTYAELNHITKNFESIIGKGGFGTVYHGKLENGDEVAVKVLMETSLTESTDFLPEVQTLSKVHHKNLVTLQGYCQNKKCLALVYDFMPRGNLQQILRGADDYCLNWEQRLHIAFDAAQGLEYLHELCTPSIVHRDVKTANIILDKNLVGIISDFGLSRAFKDATHISTVAAGTLGYLDPEYHATFQLTVKTDVYSFGIVLFEIITGQPPIITNPKPMHLPNWVREKITEGSIHDVVDKRLLDKYDVSSLQSVIDLAMDCVENAANDRPAMTEVVSRLKVWLPVVSTERMSIHGTTKCKHSMDSEIFVEYPTIVSKESNQGSSFQSGYTGGMSEMSMSSGR